jgi:hypothetical protein
MADEKVDCPRCLGLGVIWRWEAPRSDNCKRKIYPERCSTCNGGGKLKHDFK